MTELPDESLHKTDASAIHADRVRRLLAIAVDVSLGTVWRVREDVWDDRIRSYDHESTRMWHPGVSLRLKPLVNLQEAIPLLHGTSGEQGPVVARGLTEECGPNHATSFGHLIRPAQVGADHLVEPDPSADPRETDGPWFRRKRVAANLHKPRFDPSERAELESWARERGLL